MEYRVVESLPRPGQYAFYAGHPAPYYAITWNAAIGRLREWSADHGHPVHLTLCYFMARAMRSVDDFRYRIVDGEVRRYDRLHVATTLPTPDGQYAFGHFDFHEGSGEFLRAAATARAALEIDGVLRTDERPNMILFTALPGVPFTAMTHVPLPDPGDARPNVGFGRFAFDGSGGSEVPISLQVNHRFIGGRALGELVEAVGREYEDPS